LSETLLMPAHWSVTSVESPINRTNRNSGGVGTSPGINPITPYTTASLDYRASWIAGDLVARTKEQSSAGAAADKRWAESMRNEEKSRANSTLKPAKRSELPPPHRGPRFLETSGLERSLSTNIPDHPTAIQVNGLRQERSVDVMCKGHVFGVNTYDTRTLHGNWFEERCDKAHIPSPWNAPLMNASLQQTTTYADLTKYATSKVLPAQGSNSETMFTHPCSKFSTGSKEESASSNSEIVKIGGVPNVDYQIGDYRSASRFPGNYTNYQCGKQHLVSVIGGRFSELISHETTSQAAFSHPSDATKRTPDSAERCDLSKPSFQMRDPGRDGTSKMLCGIKSYEFACARDDAEYLNGHILGNPVPNKQNTYTLDEYRRRWTKSASDVVAAGAMSISEHRMAYSKPEHHQSDRGVLRPGHVGSWH